MRTEEDILRIQVQLYGHIELDWERIESDPNWRQISQPFDLSNETERQLAVHQYVSHYVLRERFLRDMPSTNGPGDIRLTEMEVINGQPNNAASSRNEGRRSTEA
jgi:hypothetical protein